MTQLIKLRDDVVEEVVQTSEERDAIFKAIELQEKFGTGKSVDLLDKYEKIIEDLIQ